MEEFELEPGEQVVRSVRRHWLIFVGRLLPYAILAALPLFVPALLARAGGLLPGLAEGASGPLWTFSVGMWWLFLWVGAFNTFVRYYLDQWVVTTVRIVDIRQYAFFRRRVSSFLLARVQDVTTNVDGFLPTLVGFGTLNVETAGRDEVFRMEGVPHPAKLRDLIMRQIAALHGAHGGQAGV
jgi:hypothetical protein